MHYVICIIYYALCIMQYIQCIMHCGFLAFVSYRELSQLQKKGHETSDWQSSSLHSASSSSMNLLTTGIPGLMKFSQVSSAPGGRRLVVVTGPAQLESKFKIVAYIYLVHAKTQFLSFMQFNQNTGVNQVRRHLQKMRQLQTFLHLKFIISIGQ